MTSLSARARSARVHGRVPRLRRQRLSRACAHARFTTVLEDSHDKHVTGRGSQDADDAPPPVALSSVDIARATNRPLDEVLLGSAPVRPKVAYQGVPGAYSEGAAQQACPDFDPLPCAQFEVAYQALAQWMADRACLPIENSLGGSIHTVYDLLLRYNVHIVGEKYVEVNHCLLALPGTKVEDLTRVLSHPQALAQCDQYLRNKGVAKEAVDDTAGAAMRVSRDELVGVGAVASRRAAELYGLEVLDEGIQDMSDNLTRFLVLSRNPLVRTDGASKIPYKTSIVFSLPKGPGTLFKALAVFALRNIDMTKIESRPLRTEPVGADRGAKQLNYLFYVDVLASLADQNLTNALNHLNETAPFCRVLGGYPADVDFLKVHEQKIVDEQLGGQGGINGA